MYMMLIGPLILFGLLFGAGYLIGKPPWEAAGIVGAIFTVCAWVDMVYKNR